MTELTHAEIKRRSELLTQARVLVNKEYITRRAEQHQHWIANSESSWRTNGALLPYPAGILYPSEDEIVAKALELYNASAPKSKSNPLPLPEVPPMSSATFNPDITATVTAQLQEVSNAVPPAVIDIPVSSPLVTQLQEPEIIEPGIEVVPEPVIEVVPEIVEPVIQIATEVEAVEPETITIIDNDVQTVVAKNSLLRNVLSGWLQKNKDKET